MDRETRRQLEHYRREEAGPMENALLDDLSDAEMDRGEFIRRATVFGFSTSMIAAALAAAGEAPLAFAAPTAAGAGGRPSPGCLPPPPPRLRPHTDAHTRSPRNR